MFRACQTESIVSEEHAKHVSSLSDGVNFLARNMRSMFRVCQTESIVSEEHAKHVSSLVLQFREAC